MVAQEPKRFADLVITGASGRIGQLLCNLALADEKNWELVAAVAHGRSAALGSPCSGLIDHAPAVTTGFGGKCDLVIDFSTPLGTAVALETALRARAALLVGTTGLDDDLCTAIEAAGHRIPVLIAPNTSLGIAVCSDAVQRAARTLGRGYRVEIVESHHRHKKDAPSGTALMLGHAAESGGASMSDDQYHSLRGGDVVGEHVVRFAGEGEYLEFRHCATSRSLFARGALKMGRWLLHQRPGFYTVADLLEHPVKSGS